MNNGIADDSPGSRVLLEGVRKDFGSRNVLTGLHVSVQPGEFLAIVGHSGGGKSTLLRLLAGLDPPTEGRVLVGGVPPVPGGPVRMMFQEPRLLPWKSVRANVGLGLGRGWHAAADQMLRQVGLADRAGDWPATLSGGQRQRVALARALASGPRLLLLDEPLGSLDALTRLTMQELIEDLWRRRRFTAVLVTHDAEEAVALADRVLILEEGRVGLELPIPLPRPRSRDNAEFAALCRCLLDRVLKRDKAASAGESFASPVAKGSPSWTSPP
jgi:sulfonate transport system ATP-binding protein